MCARSTPGGCAPHGESPELSRDQRGERTNYTLPLCARLSEIVCKPVCRLYPIHWDTFAGSPEFLEPPGSPHWPSARLRSRRPAVMRVEDHLIAVGRLHEK